MSTETINELVKFKDEIKSICKLRYKNEWNAMYAMHDWDIYFLKGIGLITHMKPLMKLERACRNRRANSDNSKNK
ncbi:Uncharacterised protein [Providencia rettgeri]|uniref:hypothetical protein n=1 Tax=Providencia rettgeri TaxID=587 RepID=UPI001EF5D223|nr:hypothetical protein [Providencia rettgeri]CAB5592259.1 Uncharacterised protein [Providencia rettgeri]CAC9118197.1 Uncharacterised protein [Providencia rettgeri]